MKIIHKHQTQNFRRINPFGIAPVKKVHNARTLWYRGPIPSIYRYQILKKKYKNKQEWTEAIKKKNIYIYI